jgi:hypothetical protein
VDTTGVLSTGTAALVGRFAVVAVQTTSGLPLSADWGQLELWPAPAAERQYRAFGVDERTRTQALTGRLTWEPRAGHPASQPRTVRLRGAALVVDNRPRCVDCSGTTYRIQVVRPDRLAGVSNAGLSGVAMVGPGGRLYDYVTDHFCAMRVADQPPGVR